MFECEWTRWSKTDREPKFIAPPFPKRAAMTAVYNIFIKNILYYIFYLNNKR